jgi:hypothetical protein
MGIHPVRGSVTSNIMGKMFLLPYKKNHGQDAYATSELTPSPSESHPANLKPHPKTPADSYTTATSSAYCVEPSHCSRPFGV